MDKRLQEFLGSWLYPFLLLGGLFSSAYLLRAGAGIFLSIATVLFVVYGSLALLEHVLPYRRDWRPTWRVFFLDAAHTLLSSAGMSKVCELTLVAGIVTLSAQVGGGSVWPSTAPLALQVVLAMVLAEFGAYWVHRWCHRTRLGWRVHRVHHTASSLHVLASGRTHPLNTLWVFGAQSLVLVLLGAGAEVLALVSVLTSINGLLQHANVAIRPGMLSLFFSTSMHHRWHHSTNFEESNTNFGNNLIVWDWLFGTRFVDMEREVEAVGIEECPIPESFVAHLASPFFNLDEEIRDG
jgi:sterol desaturase/sphingolipid hydroxylase (fatty acid hydroxylase superfamily)